MPYICLANANAPQGVIQITDLWPNESQRIPGIDPPGQNRYLRRPAQDLVGLSSSGEVVGLVGDASKAHLQGLGAYLLDCVEPGGTEVASGTITATGPLAGDTFTFTGAGGDVVFTAVEAAPTGTITVGAPVAGLAVLTLGGAVFDCVEFFASGNIKVNGGAAAGDIVTIAGVPFTAVNGVPNPAVQEFQDVAGSGSAINTATSLAAAINNAASQALLTAALDALVANPTGGTLAAANGGTDTVTLTPSVAGAWGDATLVESTGGLNFTLSGAAMVHTNPNPAVREFGSLAHYEGSADPVAGVVASLVAAINDAATVAAMDFLNGGPVPTADFGHMIAVDANPVVELTASQVGNSGTLSLVTAQLVNLAVSGAALDGHLADASAFEFDSLINAAGGINDGVATSIAAVLNHANTDAALAAVDGSSVTAVPVGAVVTATADTAGAAGSMLVTGDDPLRVVVSAGALAKTMVAWTGDTLEAAAAAIQNLVDTGAACTAAAINAALNALPGISGISVATTGTSSVADILSILAGRVYQLPVGGVKDPTGQTWDVTRQGGFTTPNVVFDTTMSHGEWRPSTGWVKRGKERQSTVIGGDIENNEIGGVRTTVDSTHFQHSLHHGQLAAYTAGITLFPDAEVRRFVSDWTRRTHRQDTLINQRVITVYDDDGTLLA